MDMGGMTMDMGSGLFQSTNIYMSHIFWYLVAAVVSAGLVGNVWQRVDAFLRYVKEHDFLEHLLTCIF
jgi:hypothetical protein